MLRTLVAPAFLSLFSLAAAQTSPEPARASTPGASGGAPVPKPGDRLPAVVLTGLANTEAKAFSDFYGRAVLIDFFAYWCVPCAQAVAHLNGLQQDYGAQGLSVLGVTSEGPKKTEPWVAKNGVQYAYGYDPSGALNDLFKVDRIPFGVLVDSAGVVQWVGDPRTLTKARIERALQGVLEQPVWAWPEPARGLAAPLAKGDYAGALEQARALGAQGDFDPVALVQSRVKAELATFEGLVSSGDYVEAIELSQRLAKELAGLPEADALAARATALRQEPEVQQMLDAYARFLDLTKRANAVRNLEEGEKLRPEIAALVKDVSGKKLERRAKALLASVDHALQNAKKQKK